MTNTIGNVLRFRKDLEPALNIFIKHDHKYSDINHKHTLDYFANAILEKYELINDTAKTLENSDSIINQIKADEKVKSLIQINKNYSDKLFNNNNNRSLIDNTINDYIKALISKPLDAKKILNKGFENIFSRNNNRQDFSPQTSSNAQTSNNYHNHDIQNQNLVEKQCDLSAKNVPKDIHSNIDSIFENYSYVKTYRYDIEENVNELILQEDIIENDLNKLIEELTSKGYIDFHTGYINCNLVYKYNDYNYNEPVRINLVGKNGELNFIEPLPIKDNAYLKNIKINGYYFNSGPNDTCNTLSFEINNIPSLIIDTYDMTDEFC